MIIVNFLFNFQSKNFYNAIIFAFKILVSNFCFIKEIYYDNSKTIKLFR